MEDRETPQERSRRPGYREPIRAGRILAGQYRIVGDRPIGAGGMGAVWLAEDIELNSAVAVKVLLPAMLLNDSAIARLRREALIGQQLAHHNICRLHGLHSDGEIKFIVMEYVDGKTLARVILQHDQQRLTWAELAPIADQIADALDYAHNVTYTTSLGQSVRGVLHRDIKPANIMVMADGTAKLMDFGIARENEEGPLADCPARAASGSNLGTLLYVSPEQYAGKEPTNASDIYSLAATFYECLSGHPPFWQGRIEEQLLRQNPGEIPGVPRHVNDALQAGLAKDTAGRPARARELVRMLAGSQHVKGKAPRKGRRFLASAANVMLSLALLGGAGWAVSRTPLRETINSLDTQRTARQAAAILSVASGSVDRLALVALREKASLECEKIEGCAAVSAHLAREAREVLARAEGHLRAGHLAKAARTYEDLLRLCRALPRISGLREAAAGERDAAGKTWRALRVLETDEWLGPHVSLARDMLERADDAFLAQDYAASLTLYRWIAEQPGPRANKGQPRQPVRNLGEHLAAVCGSLAVDHAGQLPKDRADALAAHLASAENAIRVGKGVLAANCLVKARSVLRAKEEDPRVREYVDLGRFVLRAYPHAGIRDELKKELLSWGIDITPCEKDPQELESFAHRVAMEASVRALGIGPGDPEALKLYADVQRQAPFRRRIAMLHCGTVIANSLLFLGDSRRIVSVDLLHARLWTLPPDASDKPVELSINDAVHYLSEEQAGGASCATICGLKASRLAIGRYGQLLVVDAQPPENDAANEHTHVIECASGQDADNHKANILCLASPPGGRIVASADEEGIIRIWESESGSLLHEFRLRGKASCLSFSPDAKTPLLAAGTSDGVISVRQGPNWSAGVCSMEENASSGSVQALCFSPEGKTLLAGFRDGSVHAWHHDGRWKKGLALEKHGSPIIAVACFPSDGRLISGSADGTIRIWDGATGRCLSTLKAHDGGMKAMAVSPDGLRVCSAGTDESGAAIVIHEQDFRRLPELK